MKGLNNILNHKYIIVSKVAYDIYNEKSQKVYERLRSRVKERHRYTEDEYKALIKYFKRFAKKLETTNPRDFYDKKYKIFDLEGFTKHLPKALNFKTILSKLGDYLTYYDMLRNKRQMDTKILTKIKNELKKAANFIYKNLEKAKDEAKTYNFSYGRGQHSHLA